MNPAVFCMMNNLRANNVAVFDVQDADPRKWSRKTSSRPGMGRRLPLAVPHRVLGRRDEVLLHRPRPKPMKSDIFVADTRTWKVIKKFKNVGVDLQTVAVSPCGKYVFAIFSGFQRLESGVFVFRQDTLEPLGYMPNFGGHHDCVLVPKDNQELSSAASARSDR